MGIDPMKTQTIGIIMSNPQLKNQMRDAWYAKPGSTKRKISRSTMRSINEIGQRRGLNDGMGGTGGTATSSLYSPAATTYGSTTPATGTTTPTIGTTTPALGTTTEFALPSQTGTTQPRVIQPEQSQPVYNPSATYPQFFKYSDSYSLSTPEAYGKNGKQINVTFVPDIDNVFDTSEGIGEQAVNDLSKTITGKDALSEEKEKLKNKTAAEVRAYYLNIRSNMPVASKYKFSAGPTTAPTGVTATEAAGTAATTAAASATETAKMKQDLTTMIDNIVSAVTPDKESYMASLEPNKKLLAEKMLNLINSGYPKDIAVSMVMDDLDILKKAFPGVPTDLLPVGALPEDATADLQTSLEQKYDLMGQWERLNEMKSNGYDLEDNLVDYITKQDTYLSTIDKLMNKALDKKYSGRQLTEEEQAQTDTYINFLTNMKGKQEARYIDWLNKSMTAYNNSYNRAADRFDKTKAMIEYEMAKKEPLTIARYNMYKTYMDGMYDQLALMSTNQSLSSAAIKEKMDTATSMINSIINYGKVTGAYASGQTSDPILKSLGLNNINLNTIDETGFSTAKSDALKLFADVKNDQTIIKDYNLNNVKNEAKNSKVTSTTAEDTWMAANKANIYNKALNSFSLDEVNKYKKAMDEIKNSDDWTTNTQKRDDWYKMNNMIYKEYFNGIKAQLDENPSQKADVAKYIKRLSDMDYNYLINSDGSVNSKAKDKAKDSWIPFDELVNLPQELQDQLWYYFAYWLSPPISIYGGDAGRLAQSPDRIFNTDGDDDTIVTNALNMLKKFEENSYLLEDYNKAYNAEAINPNETNLNEQVAEAENKRQEAINNTLLGDIINK